MNMHLKNTIYQTQKQNIYMADNYNKERNYFDISFFLYLTNKEVRGPMEMFMLHIFNIKHVIA